MNTTAYTVTHNFTGASVTGTVYDIEDTIRGWFPEAPANITEALDDLIGSMRSLYVNTDAAAYLGLTIECSMRARYVNADLAAALGRTIE